MVSYVINYSVVKILKLYSKYLYEFNSLFKIKKRDFFLLKIYNTNKTKAIFVDSFAE